MNIWRVSWCLVTSDKHADIRESFFKEKKGAENFMKDLEKAHALLEYRGKLDPMLEEVKVK